MDVDVGSLAYRCWEEAVFPREWEEWRRGCPSSTPALLLVCDRVSASLLTGSMPS